MYLLLSQGSRASHEEERSEKCRAVMFREIAWRMHASWFIGMNLVTRSHLAAREAEKYRLIRD